MAEQEAVEYSGTDMILVTPGYFETLDAGQSRPDFADRDNATGNQVVIVNQAFAKKYHSPAEHTGTHLASRGHAL